LRLHHPTMLLPAAPTYRKLQQCQLLMKEESRYFCESLFWASQPKQAAKT